MEVTHMKYVLLFCGTEDDAHRYDTMSASALEAQLAQVGAWFADPRLRGGIPDRPGAWLATAARRRAIDRLRRNARFRQKLALLEVEPAGGGEPDDRLRLIFTCCHPALSPRARVVLTLRAICGFTTAEIAGALLLSEAAVAQQIHRARRKIVEAGIPYRVPDAEELAARLDPVLAVLYLMFNEGYLS